jgi:uncharacterized protein YlxW (UPF0749 family)
VETVTAADVVQEVRKNRGRSTLFDIITVGGIFATLAFTWSASAKVNATMDRSERTEKRVETLEEKVTDLQKKAATLDDVRRGIERIESRQIKESERLDRMLERLPPPR